MKSYIMFVCTVSGLCDLRAVEVVINDKPQSPMYVCLL